MDYLFKQFQRNIDSIRAIDHLYQYFSKQVPAMDLSEILRAEFVLTVSAFDCYIHDIVREGMIESFQNKRSKSREFQKFSLSLEFVNGILLASLENKVVLLESELQKVLSRFSYQNPTNVENALKLISVTNIWRRVASKLHISESEVKNRLSLIVQRRNKIAHESDYNYLTGSKEIIDHSMIADSLKFIEKLTKNIHRIVTETH